MPLETELHQTDTEQDFLRLGWCPHQVHRLQVVHTPKVLSYLSSLDRREYRPNNHDACAGAPRCIANNVNLQNYNTAHAHPCVGSCPPFGVDYEAVVSIIRAGGVPLISIHIDPASTSVNPIISLRVTARTTSSRYTALSHVWFDGLGNPSANALPACQLESIYSKLVSQPGDYESGVNQIGSLQIDWPRQSYVMHAEQQSPLFWMDTLCIPVGDAEREVRLMAINQMASIYVAAVQVLVLDAELLQCKVGTSTATETLARVACSAWMTRSWTLQEGVLARECTFQFKDGAIDPAHEWCHHGARLGGTANVQTKGFPNGEDDKGWSVYKEIYDHFWDTLHQDWKSKYRRDPPTPEAYKASGGAKFSIGGFRGSQATGKIHTLPAAQGLTKRGKSGLDHTDHFTLNFGEERRLKQLVDTWNELAHRSTTMPEDLHVIIANLLDFNADTIMKISTREARMRAMLLSFQLLPISLFWNTGPKWRDEKNECNHWIPVEPSKSALTMTPVMRVTEEWLELDFDTGVEHEAHKAEFLHVRGAQLAGQTSFAFAQPHSEACYEVSLIDCEIDGQHIDERSYYLVLEVHLPLAPSTTTVRGAMFSHVIPDRNVSKYDVQLVYRCPVQVRYLDTEGAPPEHAAIAEVVPSGKSIVVKYNPLPNFIPYPRRPFRGASLQGTLPMILLGGIAATSSFACLIAFIVTIAQPPHRFTNPARGLFIAWLVIWLGALILCFAWGGFIIPVMYRMALESYEKDWEGEHRGWWGRYVKVENALGRMEFEVYQWVKGVISGLQRRTTGSKGSARKETSV